MKTRIWQVIAASSVGTMIEWYDFYIFGSLAATIAPLFYPQGNDTLAYFAYLSTFAVGFVVRPFGALFFGRIGDLVGRSTPSCFRCLSWEAQQGLSECSPTSPRLELLLRLAFLSFGFCQ